jgi:hypothetical protein
MPYELADYGWSAIRSMLPNKQKGPTLFGLQPARSSSLAIEKGFIVWKPGSRVTLPSTATLRAATDVMGETAATPSRASSVVERLLPAHPVHR